jgi:hypothetical protein
VAGHEAIPPGHFVAVWAATNFKPCFRVVHTFAVPHDATGEQHVSVGSLFPIPNQTMLSLVESL